MVLDIPGSVVVSGLVVVTGFVVSGCVVVPASVVVSGLVVVASFVVVAETKQEIFIILVKYKCLNHLLKCYEKTK